MEAVRSQARALLEGAARNLAKDEKIRKIAQLVEIAKFRADTPLLEEIVSSVSELVSDRSKAVRRSVVDFVGEVVCESVRATESCAANGVDACAFLAASSVGDGSAGLAAAALKCAARILGRFGRGSSSQDWLDGVSRKRLVESLKVTSDSAKYYSAGAECVLAVLLRDAEADVATARREAKKARASAATKEAASAIATAVTSQDAPERRAAALEACAAALSSHFLLIHRELVSAVIAALEADADDAAVWCAVSALHSAESARRQHSSQGVLAAASVRLEAALERAGRHELADQALAAARNGEKLAAHGRKRMRDDDEIEPVGSPPKKQLTESSVAPSAAFVLAPEHRLSVLLETIFQKPLPPEEKEESSGRARSIRSVEALKVAIETAIKAFASDEPALAIAELQDEIAEEPAAKRRARDPRIRRERTAATPVVVDDEETHTLTVEEVVVSHAVEAVDEDDSVVLTAAEAGELGPGERILSLELSTQQERYMRRLALERVAEMPHAENGGREARDAIVARLARYELIPTEPETTKRLLEALSYENAASSNHEVKQKRSAEEWKALNAARAEAALKLLYEAYADRDLVAYDALMVALLPALVDALAKGGPNERAIFAEAVCAAPLLTHAAVEALVQSSCLNMDDSNDVEDEQQQQQRDDVLSKKKVSLGLTALRDLALGRPKSRAICCAAALDLTRRADAKPYVRDKAVRLATNVLFPVVAVQPYVRRFAHTNATARLDDESLTADDARRELALLVALCVKDLHLVPHLLSLVARIARSDADHPVRKALDAELPRLAPALALAHGCEPVLLALAADSASVDYDSYEDLLAALVELFADLPPTRRGKGLWAGVQALARSGRTRRLDLLASAVNDATASQFLQVLPDLLAPGALDDEKVVKAFKRAASSAPVNSNTAAPDEQNLDAPQVLIALHQVEGVPRKRVTDALSLCFANRDTFGAVALRDVCRLHSCAIALTLFNVGARPHAHSSAFDRTARRKISPATADAHSHSRSQNVPFAALRFCCKYRACSPRGWTCLHSFGGAGPRQTCIDFRKAPFCMRRSTWRRRLYGINPSFGKGS